MVPKSRQPLKTCGWAWVYLHGWPIRKHAPVAGPVPQALWAKHRATAGPSPSPRTSGRHTEMVEQGLRGDCRTPSRDGLAVERGNGEVRLKVELVEQGLIGVLHFKTQRFQHLSGKSRTFAVTIRSARPWSAAATT